MKEFTCLTCEVENGVAVVTMDRPPLNLLTYTLLKELWEVLDLLAKDRDMRAVILTGAGRAFCAGMEVSSSDPPPRGYGQLLMNRVDSCRLPVICAINGYCLGGGMELALACDIRYASETARMGLVEANLGYIPAWGGNTRLPWLIGEANAKRLFYTAEKIDAQTALKYGLVQDVYPPEELLSGAKELAAKIAREAPKSVSAFKEICYSFRQTLFGGSAQDELRLSMACSASKDSKEGVRALMEKRTPHFTNE